MTRPRVLQLGMDPEVIDFSPWPGQDADGLRARISEAQTQLRDAGFDVTVGLLPDDPDAAEAAVRHLLSDAAFDVIEIGAGLRTSHEYTVVFERIVNTVSTFAPGVRLCFNDSPESTVAAVRRGWVVRRGADRPESVPTAPIRAAPVRMDNVGIVVEDLSAAIEFFRALGLRLEGRAVVEGEWAGRVTGLSDQRVEIAMLQTPDGHGRVELSRFLEPEVVADHRHAPVNSLGYLRVMFAVDDLDGTLARIGEHGAEIVGSEVVRFEDSYLLCYVRGPEGILVGLAQQLGD